MRDFLELTAVGDLENIVPSVVQIVAGSPDRAQRRVARDDAGKRNGFLRLQNGRWSAQRDSPGNGRIIGSASRR
jgi:hypothetical protein